MPSEYTGTLQEVITALGNKPPHGEGVPANETYFYEGIKQHPEIVEQLQAALAKQGVTQLRFLANGNKALVFAPLDSAGNVMFDEPVIRLSIKHFDGVRPVGKESILGAFSSDIFKAEHADFKLERLERLVPIEVTPQIRDYMRHKAAAEGLISYGSAGDDAHRKIMGKLQADGTIIPVIVEGAVEANPVTEAADVARLKNAAKAYFYTNGDKVPEIKRLPFPDALYEFKAGSYVFKNHTSDAEYISFDDPIIQQRLAGLADMLQQAEQKTGKKFHPDISIDGRYGYFVSPGLHETDPANLQLGTAGWADGRPELTEGLIYHETGHAATRNARFVGQIVQNGFVPIFLDTLEHFVNSDPQRAAGWIKATFGSLEQARTYLNELRVSADQSLAAIQPIAGKSDVELFHTLQKNPNLLRDMAGPLMGLDVDAIFAPKDGHSPIMLTIELYQQDTQLRSKSIAAAEMQSSGGAAREHFDANPVKEYPTTPGDVEALEALKPLLKPYKGATILFGNAAPAAQRAEEYLADRFALQHTSDPELYLTGLAELTHAEVQYRKDSAAMTSVFGVDQSTHPQIEDRVSVGRQFIAEGGRDLSRSSLPPPEAVRDAIAKAQVLGKGGSNTALSIEGYPDFVVRLPHRHVGDLGAVGNTASPINDPFNGRNFGQPVADYGKGITVNRRQSGEPAGVPPYLRRDPANKARNNALYEHRIALAANMPDSAYVELLRDMQAVEAANKRIDPSKANNLLIDSEAKRFNIVDLNDGPRPGHAYRNSPGELVVMLFDNSYCHHYDGANEEQLTNHRRIILDKMFGAAEALGLPFESRPKINSSLSYSLRLAGYDEGTPERLAIEARVLNTSSPIQQQLPQQQQQARPTPSAEEIARQAQQQAELNQRQSSAQQARAEQSIAPLTPEERAQYKAWMQRAEEAVGHYNGSEVSEQRLFEPLLSMYDFIRSKNNGRPSDDLEHAFAQQAWPEKAATQKGFNSYLDDAVAAYTRNLRAANGYDDVLALIQKGGAVVTRHAETFVQTDSGEIKPAQTANPKSMEIRTQPRLARLIERLKQVGIYTDDIIAHVATPDPTMVRQHPYVVLYIPRLDKEIAVCDQVGEITFVANKRLGPDVWANLSKDQLKARPEVSTVKFDNEEQWWKGIHETLMADGAKPGRKVDVEKAASKKPPYDLELIKQSILAHRQATGRWPTQLSGDVEYGPYAGKEKWGSIHAGLGIGSRGLPSGSTLSKLNKEVSAAHGLDYVSHLEKGDFELDKIKQSILAHRQATGEWPTSNSGAVEHGPYAGKEKWGTIDSALFKGVRGLPSGLSLPTLNAEVSGANKLDYVNRLQQEHFEIDKIKESVLAHRQATGKWPTGDSGAVEYGPYAGKTRWNIIEKALVNGSRGLPGESSLPTINAEVSQANSLDYVNGRTKEPLDPAKIKATIYEHYIATQQWPTAQSGAVKYGPYAGQETWSGINAALSYGNRGLTGGEYLTDLNEAVSREYKLDYINPAKKEPLTIDKIKESILAHRQATGEWPVANSGAVQHGPYANKEKWGAIGAALAEGTRGLPGGSSLPKLNAETSEANGLDYVNRLQKGVLEINVLQEAVLAHRQATGEWPTTNSGTVQHGPYAGKEVWSAINAALSVGVRGLPGGSSLAAMNAEVSNLHKLDYVDYSKKEPLTLEKIKDSITAHYQATGKWPTAKSGTVQHGAYAGTETWLALEMALTKGRRGLPEGSSLAIVKREIQQASTLAAARLESSSLSNTKDAGPHGSSASVSGTDTQAASVSAPQAPDTPPSGTVASGDRGSVTQAGSTAPISDQPLPQGRIVLTVDGNTALKPVSVAALNESERSPAIRVASVDGELTPEFRAQQSSSKSQPSSSVHSVGEVAQVALTAGDAANEPRYAPPSSASEKQQAPTKKQGAAPHSNAANASRAGGAAGAAMGAVGIAGRLGETLAKAERVGGKQLETERAAMGGDIASVVTGISDLTPGAAQAATKAGAALRTMGRVAPIVAAGAAYLEVQAANTAQDGRRGAGAVGGFAGGMSVGMATGATAGAIFGPWGAAIGGIIGGLGAGYVGSEMGRSSQWGDQRQRDLDHKAQYALDQSVEVVAELGRKRLRGEAWTDADKAAIRTIGGLMVEHVNRMQVLEIPATDVDGRLRQQYQIQQTQLVIDYLNGKTERLPMASQQRDAHLIPSIDALLPGLNDPKLGWKHWLHPGAGVVERNDVLRILSEYGVELHTLDKDGRKGVTIDELTTVLKELKVDQRGKVTPARGAAHVERPPEINDETHENFRDGTFEKSGIGQKRFEAAMASWIPELEKAGFGKTLGGPDGKITPEKLGEAMKQAGIRPSEVDQDGNGNITEREAITTLRAHGLDKPTPQAVATQASNPQMRR